MIYDTLGICIDFARIYVIMCYPRRERVYVEENLARLPRLQAMIFSYVAKRLSVIFESNSSYLTALPTLEISSSTYLPR